MWGLIAGFFLGFFGTLILARLISHETLKTHEIKPIAARRIDWQTNPIARLHQISQQSLARRRIYEEQQAAAWRDACQIIAGEGGELTEEEEDIVSSMIYHNDYEEGIVERVLRELL